MIRNTVTIFDVPSQGQRRQFSALERSLDVHEATIASLACMNSVRIGGPGAEANSLSFPFTVAA